jgi:hypothetical protein
MREILDRLAHTRISTLPFVLTCSTNCSIFVRTTGGLSPSRQPGSEAGSLFTAAISLRVRGRGRRTESYGLALRWRYWESRSVRDTADATGKTEKAIERLLAHARARFTELSNQL